MRLSLATLLFLRTEDSKAQDAVNAWFSLRAPYRSQACFYNSDEDAFEVYLIWE